MKLESIRLKNFKAFKDAELRDIPGMCVLVGAMAPASPLCSACSDFSRTH